MGSTPALTNAGLVAVANQSSITGVGIINSGAWTGDVIASAYLDADTAHLTGLQTFSGRKTFSATITQGGDQSGTPGDGKAIHVDAWDFTDSNTSGSGTVAKYTHVNIERPRLSATNSSVTTSDAATLYIDNPPLAAVNQTITRAWSMWVDGGNARFDGSIYSGTTEAMNSSGLLTVANQTGITGVGTISSGTWQGTAIASAYLDSDTAHLSTSKQFTYHMMVDDIDTTKIYIPLQTPDTETSVATNKQLRILTPVAGKLLKIFLRANTDLSSNTLTWTLETRDDSSVTAGTPSVVGTQSGAGCTNRTMTTYDFTSSLDSGDNIIDAGDTVQIAVQSDSTTANSQFYITCLWEWNLG
jgi:hypothetical protein